MTRVDSAGHAVTLRTVFGVCLWPEENWTVFVLRHRARTVSVPPPRTCH
jgi:hypothetical protein